MKIVIVGGGPAGMLAAIAASKQNSDNVEKVKEPSQVLLLEKNEKLGKKMFISGKGRCNITNNCDRDEFFKNVVRNSKFLYSAFSEFSNVDLKKMIEDNGCPLKVERGNRVFPVSDKSYDVIDALKRALKVAGVIVKLNTEIKSINLTSRGECLQSPCRGECLQNPCRGECLQNPCRGGCLQNPCRGECLQSPRRSEHCEPSKFIVTTGNGEKITADKVIIATGGLSYPSTGSTGDGYKFAKYFSINVIKQLPSLVPFNVKELEDCKSMQGLTLKNISIKIFDGKNPNKALYEDFGELLFTHFGVSGPVILSASCFVEDAEGKILSIDLKSALSFEQLDARILREFEENNNKKLKSIIEKLLPSSLVEIFIKRLDKSKTNLKEKNVSTTGDIKVSEVDKQLRKEIVELLKDFRLTIKSVRGFNESIITRGGIDVKEINPKTMESKKVKGLYFAGEVLDIDALTGGFNMQIACSTGFAAGDNVNAV